MKFRIICLLVLLSPIVLLAQKGLPTDYLSSDFHKERREALRAKMPENSVAVFFANAVRNRANDVEYVYHQDPNFYYLTGYREPHAVLVIFSDMQESDGKTYNELLYVQERNARAEMWTGYRLGVEGAKEKLGFEMAFNGKEFLDSGLDFMTFDKVMFDDFKDDYRDSKRNPADLYNLISSFKTQIGYYVEEGETNAENSTQLDKNREGNMPTQRAKIDTRTLRTLMGGLRQIKTPEEMKLLTKAVRISAMGQIEVMKAMKPNMSETEVQGIHEYVYKKYGSEYEGYPSIVGAGSNGCVLHYVENNKTEVGQDLVLMDLGAEYHGYTADVTRTIPADGTFSPEQKAIYDLVYEAQEAGIAAAVVGNNGRTTFDAAIKVINEGLVKLGILKSVDERHMYLPHGICHHIGLDVHDLSDGSSFMPNMVVTIEPGIYIPEGSPCDEKWWGIAVRIEDDILITENGPVNLSAEAPRKSDEIEALMKQPSVFDKLELKKLD
jgi:Xaa-Pro aminopeptidase